MFTEVLKKRGLSIIAFVLYGLLYLIYTYPLVLNFDTEFMGIPLYGDSTSYIWSIWHFKYAVSNGLNPFETQMLFSPEGSSILMHSSVPIAGMLNLLIDSPILTMNLVLLLSFAFSGLGVYNLLRFFKVNVFLSIAGGFIYAFFPYKTAHLPEHFNLELTALIPFFIFYILKAFRFEPGKLLPILVSKKYLFILFLLGILSLLTDHYYSVYVFYFGLLFCLLNWTYPYFNAWSTKKTWIISLLVFVLGHFLIRGLVLLNFDDKGAFWWSADIASLFVPHTSSWLYGQLDGVIAFRDHFFRYPQSVEFVMFLGYGFFVLLILFFLKLGQLRIDYNMRLMGIASIIFLLLCFPEFKILGHRLFYNITGLVYYVPFLNNVRTPPRYELMFMVLFLPVLMKQLSVMWFSISNKRIIIAAVLFLVVEYWPKHFMIMSSKTVPSVYTVLQSKPAATLLPIPFGFRDGIKETGKFNTDDFLYQTVHHKPIIGGYLSRLSEKNFDQYKDNESVREMYQLMKDSTPLKAVTNSFDLPVKYIVVKPNYIKQFETYIDSAASNKISSKKMIDGYLMYELN